VKDKANDVKDQAKDKASYVKDQASDAKDHVQSKASDAKEHVKSATEEARERERERDKERGPKPNPDCDSEQRHEGHAEINEKKVRHAKFSDTEFDNHITSHSGDPGKDFEVIKKEKKKEEK
jgi:hypothetical protein